MRDQIIYTLLSAVSATGAGIKAFVADFRHKVISIATDGMGTGDTIVVKIQGSSSEVAPDFGAAQSITNEWDYIEVIDQEDGSNIDGDTGIEITEADDVRKVAVNVDGLRHITANVTTISDANSSVTVKINLYND